MNIDLGNNKIFVKIIYKNNQNIYFRFDENAFLVVTCPKKTQEEEILRLIYKNEAALLKMYDNALLKKKEAQEFWLLGKKYNVIYNEELEEVDLNGDFVYAKDETALNEFMELETRRVFEEEISICKNCFHKLPDFKLKIRKMKTRWGVCNRKDKIITLNSELIKKKVELIDYVIIHEMAHFYEGNHSKKFWDIVALACPKYKERRKALK